MKLSKKVFLSAFLFYSIFVFLFYLKWIDRSTKIVFCDVGQGDSILIQQGFFQVIIDSGKDDRLLGCLGHVLPFWDRVIEVGVVSHFDMDHMGYFAQFMGFFEWREIYHLALQKENTTIEGLLDTFEQISKQGTKVKQPILGQSIVLPSGDKITFLEVVSLESAKNTETKELSENERSLGVLLEIGETHWLMTGDGEGIWESSLLTTGLLPQVDVLKIGHHGSETSSYESFLDFVSPKLAIVSVGAGNSYGHPSPITLQKLKERGVRVLRTDEHGDIILATDGVKIWIDELRKRPQ